MEHLETTGVGEVSRVGVDSQGKRGVRCIRGSGNRGEIPEAAVVRRADVCDTFDQPLGGFRRGRGFGREAEPVVMDILEIGR